jgi:hypothetical protein
MSHLKIYEDSKNYTGTVVRLASTFALPGLDNLVGTSVFGNVCIIPKTYSLDNLYVFFPSETELSNTYLSINNLFRNSNLNVDQTTKGYFEDNGRIKAIKFKGNKSTGIIMPVESLPSWSKLKLGEEFNCIGDICICKKYFVPIGILYPKGKAVKILDQFIDSRMFPEHIDTSHLLKNIDRLDLKDNIVITTKLHGTSARIGYTLVKRKLNWREKIARKLGIKIQEEEYSYVAGSRHVVKSIGFSELKDKNHFYEEDLWTRVSKEQFDGKLHKGEIIYYEIIGKDYTGAEIQKGYTYGLDKPTVYIYRIANINAQGIEIDLSWNALMTRCNELGVNYVPTMYKGLLVSYLWHWVNLKSEFIVEKSGTELKNSKIPDNWQDKMESYLKDTFLDKPAAMDDRIIEEGICLRVEKYPHPEVYKLKSPLFLIHESKEADTLVADVESQN